MKILGQIWICFVVFHIGATQVTISSSKSWYEDKETVVLTCTVPDFNDVVEIKNTTTHVIVSCYPNLPCSSPPSGYTANQRGTTMLDLTKASFDHTRDTGNWTCSYGLSGSSTLTLYHAIPVSTVTVQPEGVNNIVSVVSGDSKTFTCTTDTGRPAACIQWYFGGRNVTNDAVPQKPQPDGTKFISSSKLMYTWNDTDHNKSLYCEAVNIEGREKIKSIEKVIYIEVPVTTITIKPIGMDKTVNVIQGGYVNFTCTTDTSRPAALIQWYIGERNVTNDALPQTPQLNGTKFISSSKLMYTGNDTDHNKSVYCEAVNIEGNQKVKSDEILLNIQVPVSTATIQPNGVNNSVSIVSGNSTTFTCTTDASRPAAWIQWYFGGHNVTNDAVPQKPQPVGTKFISSSKLMYTWNDTDHNKSLYCEAVNIEGRQKVKSLEKVIYIEVPVTTITIKPIGMDKTVNVIQGGYVNFTCTTDTSRPAAWIQWYIGTREVTNEAVPQTPQLNGTKFISSSKLMYTGNDTDHNKSVYCEAVNIEGNQKVKSDEILLNIQVPVSTATIQPNGVNNSVSIVSGNSTTFTCTTDASRPAAWIQWYFGGHNVTNDAVPQKPQPVGTKFISSSKLMYTWNDTDHNKSLYCEAVNIEGRQKVKSLEKVIYIEVPVTTITIKPIGMDKTVNVIQGGYMNFTCTTDTSRPAAWIQWYIGARNVTNDAVPQTPQLNGTKFISSSKLVYTGNDSDHNKSVYCEAVNIKGNQKVKSDEILLNIQVPVFTATIQPNGVNNSVSIVSGNSTTFTCTTDASRPAAWIQWYFRGRNVTNDAVPQTPQPDGTKFISSSKLLYTGNDTDHNTSLYCEAVNIEGRQKVKSLEKVIYIEVPVTTITIKPIGMDKTVNVIQGGYVNFTCTTDTSRPAAWIQWYIGARDVTNDAVPQTPQLNGTKFISSSKLMYTGNDTDHNKSVYCEAVNIEGNQKVKSDEILLNIQVPVSTATIQPDGVNNFVSVVSGNSTTFTCTTDASRPAAWIQWYIGGRNVTNDAVPQTPQPDGTKFISSSKLMYTGDDTDHNKTINCEAVNIEGRQKVQSLEKVVNIIIPVTTVTLEPNVDGNDMYVLQGYSFNFTCTTDASRPAAWIQWYFGGRNVTNDAVPQTPQPDGTKFISSSKLMYTGNDTDHNKSVYCEAVNNDGTQALKSGEKNIFIQVVVEQVDIESENNITAISGERRIITCKAGNARPAAWIQWYLDGANVTKNASLSSERSDSLMYNTTSALGLIGSIQHHNKILTCTAGNIKDQAIKMDNITVLIDSSPVASELPKTLVLLRENEGFTLSVNLIANPKPTFNWTFVNMSGFETAVNNVSVLSFNNNIFKHETMYSRNISVESDYGNYTVTASNGVGDDFKITFSVLLAASKRKEFQEPPSNAAIIGGVSGTVLAVITVVLITVLYMRRRRLKDNAKEHLRTSRENMTDADDDEDGLKDNILYASSSDSVVYTQVSKRKTERSDVNETKRTDEKGLNSKEHMYEMDCVYENSKNIYSDGENYANVNITGNGKTKKKTREDVRKRNKDGLIYADLEFAPEGSKRRFVIRGLENRTNYAIIDLSKKADPLPDSDEDDVNDQSEKTADQDK